jgi:hypothetical protein
MKAVLSGQEFGRQVAFRFGIFLVLVVGAPFALYGIDRASRSDARLDEAVALVTATPLGLLLFFILVLSLVRPSWRRMKALGLTGWSGLFVPWLLLADFTYIVTTQGGWGFSNSTLDGRIPLHAITALGLIVAMACARSLENGSEGFSRFGLAGKAAFALAVLISLRIVFHFGMANWLRATLSRGEDEAPSALFMVLIKSSYWVYMIGPWACVLFLGATAWCVVLSRRDFHHVVVRDPS